LRLSLLDETGAQNGRYRAGRRSFMRPAAEYRTADLLSGKSAKRRYRARAFSDADA
jgi:hypothetical protein